MDVRAAVLDVMRQLQFDVAEIGDGTRLYEDLQIDSTERVELVVGLERRFGVGIDLDDVVELRTIDELVSYVEHAAKQPKGA